MSMELKILGKTPQTRGRLFEKFATSILEKMHYGDFKANIIKEGMEFDIKATHNTKNKVILCECKAHKNKNPRPPKDVQFFLAKFISESGKGLVQEAILISTSGFNGNALEFYDTLDENLKRCLELLGLIGW